jgi:hypothetical protein
MPIMVPGNQCHDDTRGATAPGCEGFDRFAILTLARMEEIPEDDNLPRLRLEHKALQPLKVLTCVSCWDRNRMRPKGTILPEVCVGDE